MKLPRLPLMLAALTAALAPAVATAQETSPPPAAAADAPSAPDGHVTFSGGAVAAGIGFSWGSGTLDYQGEHRTFSLNGLSVLDVGAAGVKASGEVYNLKRIEDFAGGYTAFTAGVAIAGGGGVAYLRNEKGVVLKLTSTSTGLRFNFAANGVTVRLKN